MVNHPYNIMNELVTPLSFNKELQNKILNIHIISKYFNGDLDIKLKYNSTIKNIKEEIQKIYKYIPKNKELFFGGIRLKDDNKKATDYGIEDGSIIYLIILD